MFYVNEQFWYFYLPKLWALSTYINCFMLNLHLQSVHFTHSAKQFQLKPNQILNQESPGHQRCWSVRIPPLSSSRLITTCSPGRKSITCYLAGFTRLLTVCHSSYYNWIAAGEGDWVVHIFVKHTDLTLWSDRFQVKVRVSLLNIYWIKLQGGCNVCQLSFKYILLRIGCRIGSSKNRRAPLLM